MQAVPLGREIKPTGMTQTDIEKFLTALNFRGFEQILAQRKEFFAGRFGQAAPRTTTRTLGGIVQRFTGFNN
jgi:hypothetical protein